MKESRPCGKKDGDEGDSMSSSEFNQTSHQVRGDREAVPRAILSTSLRPSREIGGQVEGRQLAPKLA